MELFKRPIFYVIIVAAIAIAFGWTYLSNRKNAASSQSTTTQTPTVSNLTNLDPTDFDPQTKTEYALAVKKALAVSPDYQLGEIEIRLDKDLTPDSVSSRYVFTSASDTKNNWMITISAVSQSYLRALVPKEDYAGNLKPINSKLWKYNFVTALQLAEKNGGLDWREANDSTFSGVKLTLQTSSDNSWLTWIVEYQSDNGSKIIKLDANSGNVLDQ